MAQRARVPVIDRGPWRPFHGPPPEKPLRGVISEDFEHDVVLRVEGDFYDEEQKLAYCEWLLGVLNGDRAMKQVKIRKDKLREIVQQNRDGHRAQWEDAFSGYRTAIIAALEQNLEAFKAGKVIRISIIDVPPEEHTGDYDDMLRKLELSVDDEVVLDEEEFSNYVMDDWSWKRNWSASNAKYMSNDVNTLRRT